MINELKIKSNIKMKKVGRSASDSDFDVCMAQDSATGVYYGFINSNYNIHPITPIISKFLLGFNPLDADESLRNILKMIDSEMVNRQMVSRCVILIYRDKDKTYIAKAGGGIFVYAIHNPPISGLPIATYKLVHRSWESERDFFVGSGAVVPYIETEDSSVVVSLLSNPMLTKLEVQNNCNLELLFENFFIDNINKKKIDEFLNDVLDYAFEGKTKSHVDAYFAFI